MNKKHKPSQVGGDRAKVLIVDDHPVFRQGLSDLVNSESDLVVCGEAEDAVTAIKAIESLGPDMVVVDITLKDTSGLELIKDIKVRSPNLPVLTLSMHDESLYAERALRAGAKGYIMKQEATERVIEAIRRVLKGEIYVSESMASKIMSRVVGGGSEPGSCGVERLSDREFEVFKLIGQGFGTHQIAEKLHLSGKTIETHRAHIKEKLHLADAAELRQYAIQWVGSEPAV